MLWLLAIVPAIVAVLVYSQLRRRKRLARFGDTATIRSLMSDASRVAPWAKTVCFAAAIVLMVCALARPQVGSKLREVTVSGGEMMLVVDVSNSMLAKDFEPSRLERTKFAIGRLLDELEQDRVGLVVFAGEAYIQLPITADYTVAKNFVRSVSPSMVSRQGTALGAAIDLAASGFSGGSSGEGAGSARSMILVTDGENHEDDALEAARRAAEKGIKIYAIGIGTPQGAPIETDGELLKDENGEIVVSKLDEATLQKIALETDGAYIRSTAASVGLQEITERIAAQAEGGEQRSLMFEEWGEMYAWFLGAALFFLLVGWAMGDKKNRSFLQLRITK